MDRQTSAPPTSAAFGLRLAAGALAGAACAMAARNSEFGWLASLGAYSLGGTIGFVLGALPRVSRDD